jgi:hypothetical protein
MGVLEFISAILSALAWPVAIVLIVIVLRRPLRHLLSRLETLKGPGVEATFQRQLEEAKEEAVAAAASLPAGQRRDANQQERLEYSDLLQLADLSPRAAILDAWLRLEFALTEAAKKADVPLTQRGGILGLIEELEKRGVIAPELRSPLRRLRNLRNVAVHTMDFDISKDSVIDYIDTANFIIRSLEVTPIEDG